jgi:hypothetical protein
LGNDIESGIDDVDHFSSESEYPLLVARSDTPAGAKKKLLL